MTKPICMATWRYKKPDKGGHRGLKSLLKYVTFREDAHHQIPENGQERWHDVGLGKTWREVYEISRLLTGEYILAHHFVIAPDPDLMQLIPEGQRRDVLQELTIDTLMDWYQARDLAVPEMSFVLHDRETTDEKFPGRQMLHSHSFCAGSIPTLEGRQCPLVKERDVVRNKGGLDRDTNLNRIVEQNWAAILDREIGLGWRREREMGKHLQPSPELSIDPPEVKVVPVELPPPEPSIDDLLSELEAAMEQIEIPRARTHSFDIGF
ncbi:MAG: hypothetical protein ACYDBJ_24750 [Aggregatilineales bacterium]